MKNKPKLFNIEKIPLRDGMMYETAYICYNCNEIFYCYTFDTSLEPVVCPFCKSKRRGIKLWQRNRS